MSSGTPPLLFFIFSKNGVLLNMTKQQPVNQCISTKLMYHAELIAVVKEIIVEDASLPVETRLLNKSRTRKNNG